MPYLYLSLTPESLIASMLEPSDFGRYLAISPNRTTSGSAIFFELDADQVVPLFNVAKEFSECVAHSDGAPRASAYLAIYRVLERVPLSAFRSLYLATKDGLVLELKQAKETATKASDGRFHLYQELSPLTPRVVSRLSPGAFGEYMTSNNQALSVPKLVFADMRLGSLATDPGSSVQNLPYSRIEHLRECLNTLRRREDKQTKVVNRDFYIEDLYYNLETGFYLSGEGKTLHYPMLDEEVLAAEHNAWRKSAESTRRLL